MPKPPTKNKKAIYKNLLTIKQTSFIINVSKNPYLKNIFKNKKGVDRMDNEIRMDAEALKVLKRAAREVKKDEELDNVANLMIHNCAKFIEASVVIGAKADLSPTVSVLSAMKTLGLMVNDILGGDE